MKTERMNTRNKKQQRPQISHEFFKEFKYLSIYFLKIEKKKVFYFKKVHL